MIIYIILFLFLLLISILYSPIRGKMLKKDDIYKIKNVEKKYMFKEKVPILKQKILDNMYDILLEFTKLDSYNKFDWWVGTGTLLGAIRHNGFIPYDDDIDINIPYSEISKLEKAIDLYNADNKNKFSILKTRGGGFKLLLNKNIYPYLDIVIYNLKDNIWQLCYPIKNGKLTYEATKNNPKEVIKPEWLYPLKEHNFEDFKVYIPNFSKRFLFQLYGDKCLDSCRNKKLITWNNHKYDIFLFQLGLSKG